MKLATLKAGRPDGKLVVVRSPGFERREFHENRLVCPRSRRLRYEHECGEQRHETRDAQSRET